MEGRLIRKITFLYYGPDEATIAYHRLLGAANLLGLEVLRGIDRDGCLSKDNVRNGDIIVIQRDVPRSWHDYKEAVKIAREFGKPIIWDLDDLLFDLPPEHPDRQTHYFAEALIPMLGVLYEADIITVSTKSLQDYLSRFRDDVFVLPNFLNDQLWSFRYPQHLDKTSITIGFFGGHSHRPDIEMIFPVLTELNRKYPNKLKFVFWGKRLVEGAHNIPSVILNPIDIYSYPEFVTYIQNIEVDILIAPLRDSLFNRCKSGIKFLEYSALGKPGVFQNLEPYSDLITHGYDGFLASSNEEWVEYLSLLIEDSTLRTRIAQNAQKTVRDKWLLSKNYHLWMDIYQKAFNKSRSASCTPINDLIQSIAQQLNDYHQSLRESISENQRISKELKAQIDEIKQGYLWRFLHRVWRIRLVLAPPGSKQEQILKLVKKK